MRLVPTATLCLAALTTSAGAVAQQDARHMDRAMAEYFAGEKRAGAAALGIGLSAGGIATGLLVDHGEFAVGMAIPLIAAGSLQTIIGTVLLARTGGQLADLRAKHTADPAAYRAEELPRMEGVNFWFGVYKVAWITLIAAGAAGVAYGTADDRPGFVGAGVGLMAQSSITLVFDVFAEDRATEYTEKIKAHTPATIDAAIGPGGISLHGSF